MATNAEVWNRALAEIGNRNRVATIDDDSEEAATIKVMYDQLVAQLLGMAPWNFARKSAVLQLLKIAPGVTVTVPGHPGASAFVSSDVGYAGWLAVGTQVPSNLTRMAPFYPPPPWAFVYTYPADCALARAIIPEIGNFGQVDNNTISPPLFSTSLVAPALTQANSSFDLFVLGRASRFEVGTDIVGQMHSASTYSGCTTAQIVLDASDTASNDYYNGMTVYVDDGNGHTYQTIVTDYINSTNTLVFAANANLVFGTNSYSYIIGSPTRVLFTNEPDAILAYNKLATDPVEWLDPYFIEALAYALAGSIALPLKSPVPKSQFYALANNYVLQTRERYEGVHNSGMRVIDGMPDWITARSDEEQSQFNETNYYLAPYNALFPVT